MGGCAHPSRGDPPPDQRLPVIVIPRAQQNAAAGEDVTLIWEYATDLFRRDTVLRMWDHYQALLASLLADPARPVSAASVLDPAERTAGSGRGRVGTKSLLPCSRLMEGNDRTSAGR